MRSGWRVTLLALAALLAVVPVAGAHGGKGPLVASDYRAEIRSVTPVVAGLRVAVLENDARLQLVAPPGRTVIVLGFAGEPFLRVGPGGVFVNDLSPQAHTVRMAARGAPIVLDPAATPRWRRIGDGPAATWHDHRLAPPVAADAPPGVHGRISIGLVVDGRRGAIEGVRVLGAATHLPLLVALIAAIALVGLVLPHRLRPTAVPVLAAVAAAAMGATAAGAAIAGPRSTLATVLAVVAATVIACVLPVTLAAVPGRHRLLVAGCGGLTAAFLGAGQAAALAHSFANSALPSVWVRALTVVAIGCGLAAALAAARALPWAAWWRNEAGDRPPGATSAS
jgi:hypothetical protein